MQLIVCGFSTKSCNFCPFSQVHSSLRGRIMSRIWAEVEAEQAGGPMVRWAGITLDLPGVGAAQTWTELLGSAQVVTVQLALLGQRHAPLARPRSLCHKPGRKAFG